MLTIESPNFLALPSAAAKLFEESATESFYSSAAWYDLMSKYGVESTNQTRLYLDTEDLQSGLALVSQTCAIGNIQDQRILHSLTNAYSCEHAVIASPTAERAAGFRRLAEHLANESPAWDRLMLSGFDEADPALPELAAALRHAGMIVKPFFDSGTWYEITKGISFAEYLANRPSVLRSTWRRKEAKLESCGGGEFMFLDSSEKLESGISHYQEVYANSWKPDEHFPFFIPELIRMAARLGALRMGILHFRGRPMAAQFWIVWNGRACIYKLAHDRSADDFSLGTILTMRMMELVIGRDKPVEVNFGRGDDPYKKLWLSRRRERWGLAAANPRTLRGFGYAVRQSAARLIAPLRHAQPRSPI